MNTIKNVAVILAGGSGQRLGDITPKQFIKIAGKKVIEHTLDIFQSHSLIDEIVVVSHPNYIRDIEDIAVKNCYTKLKKILMGGKERYHSSLAAINAYDEEVNFIFHDSVRPLVNDRIIKECIKALNKYNAVDVAIPTTDTIIQVDENNEIIKIPSRSTLRNGQTPQAFKRSIIKAAYDKALKDPDFETTDDCGVVLKYLPEVPIYVVNGEQFNMKLTYKEDIFLLDKLFQLKTIASQNDTLTPRTLSRLRSKVIVVFGGNSGIGKEVVKLGLDNGAHVYPFSRENGIDISNPELVRDALKDVYIKEGCIDSIVNTAGVLDKQPLNSMSYEDVMKSIGINYFGSIIVAKESFIYLKESKGSLLFFTSSSYTRGRSLYSLYSSSKAALVNLVQALSDEWASFGIKINCINPERCKTPMRVKNFGIEPAGTLLDPLTVAIVSMNSLFLHMTGEIIDVKIKNN
jgi:ribitol-5-phosphate 2-dehydrogenase (NADP+) / D-ribitol-5-phosphate cytidylyltransferase